MGRLLSTRWSEGQRQVPGDAFPRRMAGGRFDGIAPAE